MQPNEEIDLQPLLDTQQTQLSLVIDTGASIDAKALGLFAATLAVLIFIGQSELILPWQGWIGLFGLFFVSLVFNIAALYPRKYISGSVDLSEDPDYYAMPPGELMLQLVANNDYAIRENRSLNDIRWRYCALAFIFAALGALVLFALLLL